MQAHTHMHTFHAFSCLTKQQNAATTHAPESYLRDRGLQLGHLQVPLALDRPDPSVHLVQRDDQIRDVMLRGASSGPCRRRQRRVKRVLADAVGKRPAGRRVPKGRRRSRQVFVFAVRYATIL